ncbi:hypothetical protein COY61_00190 [bacterium (Candidatus Gribaldobacteria) CG_4_10_14_0_8_um_filter_33_9]|uniref:Uncharacterized protein n=1 Tax=bacterium (Candidatus Gribaldobacteria) CG_4_10_14_0_8_um_filter_33_9 TaxID=2014266 RepID=A0A2M7RP30_9BACT|nr:MAG: hypothetical protein COY61_00190 [bacterium (Candidatus Gribaldobacteria) CG_4_10_14_0_8_um_filter_33_9]
MTNTQNTNAILRLRNWAHSHFNSQDIKFLQVKEGRFEEAWPGKIQTGPSEFSPNVICLTEDEYIGGVQKNRLSINKINKVYPEGIQGMDFDEIGPFKRELYWNKDTCRFDSK